ncbi:MAG: HAD-IC family P-type ATPase [Clostridia bacterium]|nr:HAD-IC family P-type ATPase [Clostridia bacterium]
MSKIIYRGKKNTQTAPEGEEAKVEVTPVESAEVAESAETAKVEATVDATPVTPAEEAPKPEKKPVKTATTVKSRVVKPKESEAVPEEVAEDKPAPEEVADENVTESETAAAFADAADDDEPTKTVKSQFDIDDDEDSAKAKETFDKAKIIKYFKRHPKMVINTKVDRFTPELKKGLSPEQVETRFKQFLFNDTNKKYSKSYASIFIGNICTFFNLLCLIAFIFLILAGTQGFTNYLVIIITAANVIIGIVQEIRSKLAIDKLAIMASSLTKVLRDGEVIEIPTSEVVLDDIIITELGNQVPADCILAEGTVEVNESLLTGESVSIKKQIGDTLYAGSFIASGNGKCRVDKVGKETFLEKLTAKAKKYKRPNSELINSMQTIIKFVSIAIFPIAIFVFIVTRQAQSVEGVEVIPWLFKEENSQALAKTCSVVIGMIPSGMLLLTSVALAVGVLRLSKNNTLVRDLYSLEMLARVNVLCLDKTGTITDGRMKVNDAVILNTVGEYSLNDIMGCMLSALDDNNQTSIALYNHFGHSDILTPTAKIPFSSKRKLSAVSFADVGTFVMGAPEFVLKPLPTKVERIVKQYAQMGLRVIVLAHSSTPIIGDKLPAILKPIAVISIADNIREDAIETIKWFKENDVQVKVISGDNPVTVSEVAKRAGIDRADKFISLEGLNNKEVENVANKYTVFGRVTPEQKAILVRAIKTEGNTVAMTGDGVNDILALKEADCAISVASGSEAARNVSHLVLMDNNFGNMPKVVGEGRRVINNIKNSASLYLMKTLFTAILAIICCIERTPYLFMPSNMLLLELFVIGVPSFFLSLQPNNARVEGKFITYVMSRSISGALIMILCVLSMHLVCTYAGSEFSGFQTSMCMIALVSSGLVMLFRVCQPFNGYRLVLFVSMVVLTILALALPPLGRLIYIADALCTGWADLKWDYPKLLIVAVAIEAAFPLSQSFIKIMQIIMPSSTEGSKKNDEKKGKRRGKENLAAASSAPAPTVTTDLSDNSDITNS